MSDLEWGKQRRIYLENLVPPLASLPVKRSIWRTADVANLRTTAIRTFIIFKQQGYSLNFIMSTDIQEIRALLVRYQDALNAGNPDDALALYTKDGIVMPQHSLSHIGTDAIRQTYNGFFSIIKFDVKFDIKEVVPTAPDWAFARTESKGTTDVKGRGIGNEANQELFVLQKVQGEWKIARYCFSTTNPPPA